MKDASAAPRTTLRIAAAIVAALASGAAGLQAQETASQLRELAAQAAADTFAATLTGLVFDSTASAPLSGARVAVGSVPRTAVTDSAGRFRVEDVPTGEHEVRFHHPRLEELGVRPPVPRVRLQAGDEARLLLFVPSSETILRHWCGPVAGEEEGAVRIGGLVRDSFTGVPLPNATVVLRVSRPAGAFPERAEAVTDRTGRNRFCGVPGERWATLVTVFRDRESDPEVVRLPADGAVLRDFGLVLTDPARLTGRVVEHGTSTPVEGALVGVEGAERSDVTDASGRFELSGVASGRLVLVTERLGFASRRDTLTIHGGERLALEIHVSTEAIALEPLVVEARSREEAMPWSVGTRIDGLTAEEVDAMRHRVHSTGDILANANVPGLHVRPTTFNEGGSHFNGLCVELSRSRRLHRDACAMAEVYVDDVRMNAPELNLDMIDHEAVRMIQFLSPLEAGAAYGHRARNGAVLIYTRDGEMR